MNPSGKSTRLILLSVIFALHCALILGPLGFDYLLRKKADKKDIAFRVKLGGIEPSHAPEVGMQERKRPSPNPAPDAPPAVKPVPPKPKPKPKPVPPKPKPKPKPPKPKPRPPRRNNYSYGIILTPN